MIKRATVPGIEGKSMSSKDWEYLPIEFLNRFSFQMSELANLVKLWIFSRQIPINQKSLPGNIFGWVQMQISFFCRTFVNPQNLIK